MEKALGLGAKVLIPPTMLPEGDEMAVLHDPHGMSFAVWRRPASHNAGFQIDAPIPQRRAVFVQLLHEAQPHSRSFLPYASDQIRSEVFHKALAVPQREGSDKLFEV